MSLNIKEESRRKYIDAIISYFLDERNEEIGVIAAEDILDFFLKEIGDDLYKKAVKDIKKVVKERMEDLGTELDIMAD
jgi:uncharacterized protein (DUF2164 family)